MAKEFELALGGGRRLRVYDTAPGDTGRLPVLWHHGTPNIGSPPEPLFDTADRLGLRWVSYDRPGYGGSTAAPGRNLALSAAWARHVADALGLERFAVMGHSGGGSHALASAALLGTRVLAAISIAGLAPRDPSAPTGPPTPSAATDRPQTPSPSATADRLQAPLASAATDRTEASARSATGDRLQAPAPSATADRLQTSASSAATAGRSGAPAQRDTDRLTGRSGVAGGGGFDWFAGMTPTGEAALRAACEGRAARERHEATAEYDPEMFTPEDHAALRGEWSWFDSVVGPAVSGGPGGAIDDDVAYATPWGCDPAVVTAPILLVHGDRDRVVPHAHGRWLADRCPTAELRLLPGEGHISVLGAGGPSALEWLAEAAGRP